MRIAIETENPVRGFVVNDGIRVFGGRNASKWCIGLQIEHHDGPVLTGRRKPSAGICGNRHAVRPLDARDLAEELAGVLVDHHDSILPADKEAVAGRIRHEVVPRALATQLVRVDDLIRRRALRNGDGCREQNEWKREISHVARSDHASSLRARRDHTAGY